MDFAKKLVQRALSTTLFCCFFFLQNVNACDGGSVTIDNVMDNGDGTFTYTITFTMEFGSGDVTYYGSVFQFQSSGATPSILSYTTTIPAGAGGGGLSENLTGLDGANVNSLAGDSDWAPYDNLTNVVSYEYGGFGSAAFNDFTFTIDVVLSGCAETLFYDSNVNAGNTACQYTASTGLNCGCIASIDNTTVTGATSIGTNQYELDWGANIAINTTGTYPPAASADPASFGYAVFSCPPTLALTMPILDMNVTSDNCYLGYITDDLGTDINDAGSPYAGMTVYFLPVTFDDNCSTTFDPTCLSFPGGIDTNSDGCLDIGDVIEITYLPEPLCDCTTPDCPVGGPYPSPNTNFADCEMFSSPMSNTTFTTCHIVSSDANGFVGLRHSISANGGSQANCTDAAAASRTVELYAISGGSCVGGPIVPTTTNAGNSSTFNPEWDNLTPNTDYIACVTVIVGSTCQITQICLDYYSPPQPCGTCTTPDCPIGNVPTYDDRIYGTCAITNTATSMPTTNCYPVTADAGGFVGFANQIGMSPGICNPAFDMNITWELTALNDCGNIIPNPVTNANNVGSGFNPEYSGLTPNGQYVLCVTYEDASFGFCTLTDICVDYYGQPCTAPLAPSITGDNGPCSGAPSITYSTAAQTGATFTWTVPTGATITGQGTNAITVDWGTTSGNVCVTVDNGCPPTTNACFPVTFPTITTSGTPTMPTCGGNNDGSISLSSDGTAPFDYTYTGTASGSDTNVSFPANITGLTAGTYNFTVTDANGCEAMTSVTITDGAAITASGTPTMPTCGGNNDGSISLSSDGTAPFSYTYTGTASGNDTNVSFPANITGLTAGTYNFTVTDANGCEAMTSVTIADGAPITASGTPTPTTCGGNNDGSISLSSDGTAPFSYTYTGTASGSDTNVSFPANITGLTAGTYNFTVTDANGCEAMTSVTIADGAPITASGTPTPTTCGGNNDGSISLSSDGTAPFSYTYTGTASGSDTNVSFPANITGLTAGTYNFTVTDANGCEAMTSVTITDGAPITASGTPTPTTCGGNNDGSISLSSDGTAPFSYTYTGTASGNDTNVSFPANITDLTAGTYNFTVTDANGCEAMTSVTIADGAPITASGTPTPTTCGGNNDGSISLSSDGTAPFSYTYTGTASGSDTNVSLPANITGLTAGTYNFTVTDANGCEAMTSVTIADGAPITASGTPTPTTCGGNNDGSISLSSDGTAPFSYTYTGTASGSDTNVSLPANITGLTAGTYNFTVTDANGCEAMTSVTITDGATITTSGTPMPTICAGSGDGSIALNSDGIAPFDYTYTGTASGSDTNVSFPANITGLDAGNYNFTVTDANGCEAMTSVTIADGAPITASGTPTPTTCGGNNDGSISLSSDGTAPFSYTYTGTASGNDTNVSFPANITGLTAGTYNFTVTDANGCEAMTSVTIADGAPIIASGTPTPTTCGGNNDGSISLSSDGTAPFSYTYTGTASGNDTNVSFPANITGLTAGTYNFTVTDANGCQATTSVTVTDGAGITATAIATTAACPGSSTGAIQLDTPNGVAPFSYTYSGTDSGSGTSATAPIDVTGLMPGSYTFVLTDDNGCTANANVTVSTLPVPTATLSGGATICEGDNADLTFTLTGTPPFTLVYQDQNGTPFNEVINSTSGTVSVSPTSTTIYSLVSVSDANCVGTVSGSATVTIDQALALPNVSCTSSTQTSVTFGWSHPTATDFEYTISIDGGAPTAPTMTSNTTYTENGLTPGQMVTITIIAISNNACPNSTVVSQTCTAIDCPTITPMITNVDATYCNNAAPFTLMATPAGGTFSGPGVTGSTFTPANAGTGPISIIYDYTDIASGCDYQATIATNIAPEIPAPILVCGTSTTSSVEFTWNNVGATQYEITWTGAANGSQVITGTSHIVTGLMTGQSVTATIVAIGPAPCGNSAASNSVTCTSDDCPTITPTITNIAAQYCANEAAFALQATPAGGTFGGSGVSGGQFNPANATPGLVTITYDYTDPSTNCPYTTSITTTIIQPLAAPIIQCGATTTSSVEFIWSDVGVAQYEITWTGAANGSQVVTGTSHIVTGLSVSDAITASVVAIGSAPCGNSAASTTTTCTAADCPTITPTITGLAAQYCSNEPIVMLVGTPAGGTFSGTSGVIGNQFNPATATPGLVTVTYDYFDAASACSYSVTANTTVFEPLPTPTIFCGASGIDFVEFTWTGNTGDFLFSCVMPDGSTETMNVAGNSFTVTGLNPGDVVSASVIAVGNPPCGNSASSTSVDCQATDCPTIVPTLDNLPAMACSDAAPLTLMATPAGGTFSGNGVTGNILNFSGLTAGPVTVTYNYIDAATGCEYTTIQDIDISNPLATPVIACGATTTNSVEFTWSDVGATDYEITWTGAANGSQIVMGTSFIVTGLSINDAVTASVVAIGGAPCGNSAASTTTECTAADCPTITAEITGLNSEYCADETTIALNGMPAGGTFSGDGVTGSNFNPSAVVGNTATIVYTYTDAASACEYTAQEVISIVPTLASPNVSCGTSTPTSVTFNWDDLGITDYQISISINGGMASTQTVNGTTYTETGLMPGDMVTIEVIGISTTLCPDSPMSTVTCPATACPTIVPTIDNLPAIACSNAMPLTLMASPAGGTFGGQGVSGNTLDFNGLTAGPITITYDYTDAASGCDYSTTAIVEVSNPLTQPVILCGATTTNSVEFTWSDVGATDYEITWTGAANGSQIVMGTSFIVTGLSINDAVTASVVAIGSAPCGNSAASTTTECTAADCPTITAEITGLNSEYCADETTIALNGMPAGGTFSGDGVTGSNFNPSAVVGNTATIVYTYTDAASACDYSTQQVVTIVPTLASPNVSCGTSTPTSVTFNWDDLGITDYQISISINGGMASTQTVNGTTYTQTGLMPGDMVTIEVIGISTTLCPDSPMSTATCPAEACPTNINPTIDNLNAEYCQTDAAFMLQATPAGGTFGGNGLMNGEFNPMTAGLGPITITYTYIDPATGCEYMTTAMTTIFAPLAAPTVSCQEVGVDFVTFEWADVGAAEYMITVVSTSNGTTNTTVTGTTYTENGLSVNEEVTITVVAIGNNICGDSAPSTTMCTAQDCPTNINPTIDNLSLEYCANEGATLLMGSPAGGTFSGDGVTGNSFDPADVMGTSTTIIYTYIDPATGCEYSTQQSTTILPPFGTPVVSCGAATMNSVTFNWTSTGSTEYEVTVTIAGQAPTTTTTTDLFLVVNGLNPSDMVSIEVVAIGQAPCDNSPAGTATCQAEDCVPSTAAIAGMETVCGGQSATITFTFNGTGPYNVTYLANGGTPVMLTNISNGHVETVSPFTTTDYTIDVAEDLGNANCAVNTSGTASITVSTNITLDVAVTSDFNGNAISCNGESDGAAVASNPAGGTAPYNYTWSTGQTGDAITNLVAGTYEVTVTDANGCSGTNEVTLTEPTAITAEFTTQSPLCFGDNNGWITIQNLMGGAEPFMYSLNNGAFVNQDSFPNLSSGEYTITVEDANGCATQSTQTLIQADEIVLDLGETIEADLGDEITITAMTNADFDTIIWTPFELLDTTDRLDAILTATETTTFQAQVIDINGCTATDNVNVIVKRDLGIYVPSGFSPNDDGVNDVFMVFAGPQVKIIRNFSLFERWGDHIFTYSDIPPNDSSYGWNGTFRGKPLNPNVFVWMVEVEYIDGTTELIKGDVTLVR